MKYNKAELLRNMTESMNDEINGQSMEDLTDLYGERKKAKADIEMELKEAGIKAVMTVAIEKLKDNPLNHFSKMQGEQWDEFLESVKTYGIISPVIARKMADGNYEIISGHNRVRAARAAGLETVPVCEVEVDDVEASVLMGLSNTQRENTTDLEWGWAYRNTYEALKRPSGERTDLTSGHDDHMFEEGTSGHEDHRLRTVDIVAEKYGVSAKTLQRKLRLTYLLKPLYECFEKKRFNQDAAVQLSYLTESEQGILAGCLEINDDKIDVEVAKRMKELSEKAQLDSQAITKMLAEMNGEPQEKQKRQLKYQVSDDCFPEGLKKGERAGYIEKALRYIMLNNIDLN